MRLRTPADVRDAMLERCVEQFCCLDFLVKTLGRHGFVGGADTAAVSALLSVRASASLGVSQGARSASVASGAFVSFGCFSHTFAPDISCVFLGRRFFASVSVLSLSGSPGAGRFEQRSCGWS